MARIPPVTPPFDPVAGDLLAAMMPPGVEPIGLFRTFVRNTPMTEAMRPWGTYELGRRLSVDRRQREIVINRTCARCGCEYEWGVHVSVFAARVGLDEAQLVSLTHGGPEDPCWTDDRERLLVRLVDQLHDRADVDDGLWQQLDRHFSPEQLLDLCLLTGWYHAISFVANAARVDREPGTPRFADVLPG